MAVIKKFDSFENKDDIFELIDKFDKSSLFELDISIAYPTDVFQVEREVKIKMMKTSGARNNYWDTHRDIDEEDDEDNFDDVDDNRKENAKTIKMTKSEKPADANSVADSIIKAPLIGTFYASPSPDSEAYVKVGDKVEKGMVLCIIEAMKIMNEIESETNGEIAEILAKTGDVVEYGQPLFRLK
ncbi:MAG: acetyl-CoA carboxylase biotin carboxyl carrier protein [Oscillospiraceae bacterium]|nr:acetyl-CoA carboxylase biotin carboxyl carrier protein [Oscillospiraceae bacterium]